jgi:fatty acid desaturase
MGNFPYKDVEVAWKRPPINRETLRKSTKRSNTQGLLHSLGVLAILGASGASAYYAFSTDRWIMLAIALYLHGGLFAFNPQTHELSHGTVFRSKWLNTLFKRIFGLLRWTSNSALYKMSHTSHHLYTTHRASDGEVVLPHPETTEQILHSALRVVDLTGFVTAIYDQVYSLFKPFEKNTRRSTWQRYVYSKAKPKARRDLYWTHLCQFLLHVAFAAFAIAVGEWFLIVVVSLPAFYGGRWYHLWVHDTMHAGREPETSDFRVCCRTIKVDPFTSFMYWHMEWHTEHHAFASIPCYNLRKFHNLTEEHWDKPQTLFQAWREMNRHSWDVLAMEADNT